MDIKFYYNFLFYLKRISYIEISDSTLNANSLISQDQLDSIAVLEIDKNFEDLKFVEELIGNNQNVKFYVLFRNCEIMERFCSSRKCTIIDFNPCIEGKQINSYWLCLNKFLMMFFFCFCFQRNGDNNFRFNCWSREETILWE